MQSDVDPYWAERKVVPVEPQGRRAGNARANPGNYSSPRLFKTIAHQLASDDIGLLSAQNISYDAVPRQRLALSSPARYSASGMPSPSMSDADMSMLVGEANDPYRASLHDLFLEAASARPNAKALVSMHQPASLLAAASACSNTDAPYLTWTHQELVRASHAFAEALAAAGIRPGMCVTTPLTCCAEYHVVLRACLELGCTFAPLSFQLVTSPPTLLHSFSILNPAVVVARDLGVAQQLENAASDFMSTAKLKLVIGSITPSDPTWLTIESLERCKEQYFRHGCSGQGQ